MIASDLKFHELVEAVSALEPDAQGELIDIIKQRLIQHDREAFLREAQESREAFERGELKPQTVDEIMRDLDS